MAIRLLLPLLGALLASSATAEPWLGTSVWLVPDVYLATEPMPTGPMPAGPVPAGPRPTDKLFSEAKAAAARGETSRAFELATLACHLDRQHAEAARVLGYELVDGELLTPYQSKQQNRGYQWDARYGWIRPDDLDRYNAGERRLGRRWVTAADDAAAHQSISEGWTVRTDHFVVITNHSLEAGAELAAELESLFQVWRQWFAGYWLSDREVRALFDGERKARKRSRQMKVFYHRDKASYVEHLRRRQPRIADTLGIYFDDRREAHFFAPSEQASQDERDQVMATLRHEAAHQMFSENGPGKVGAGRDDNFWLIEGVACYFELLSPVAGEGRYTLGNPNQGRLPSAVAAGPVAPLSELARYGSTDLQRLENLAAVYAQATGLVAMLRHGDKAEQDREALVGSLRALYSRRSRVDELARQTGRSFAELDREYREFLNNLTRR